MVHVLMVRHTSNRDLCALDLADVASLSRALPARCRRKFAQVTVYGLNGKENADRLGIPAKTAEASDALRLDRCPPQLAMLK